MEAGLSDFHKATVAILETNFERLKPKVARYRNYKRFLNDSFQEYIFPKIFGSENLSTTYNMALKNFCKYALMLRTTLHLIRKNTPKKTICFFMNKSLNCAHMKRIQLGNSSLIIALNLTDILFPSSVIVTQIY